MHNIDMKHSCWLVYRLKMRRRRYVRYRWLSSSGLAGRRRLRMTWPSQPVASPRRYTIWLWVGWLPPPPLRPVSRLSPSLSTPSAATAKRLQTNTTTTWWPTMTWSWTWSAATAAMATSHSVSDLLLTLSHSLDRKPLWYSENWWEVLWPATAKDEVAVFLQLLPCIRKN